MFKMTDSIRRLETLGLNPKGWSGDNGSFHLLASLVEGGYKEGELTLRIALYRYRWSCLSPERRPDTPSWIDGVALATCLHHQHSGEKLSRVPFRTACETASVFTQALKCSWAADAMTASGLAGISVRNVGEAKALADEWRERLKGDLPLPSEVVDYFGRPLTRFEEGRIFHRVSKHELGDLVAKVSHQFSDEFDLGGVSVPDGRKAVCTGRAQFDGDADFGLYNESTFELEFSREAHRTAGNAIRDARSERKVA